MTDFSLLEFVPDAIVIADGNGRVVYVNRMTAELFGYESSEILGQPVEMLLPARFRDMHERHRADYDRAPVPRPMGLGLSLYAMRKGGEEFQAEISLSPLDTGTGRFAVAAIRDVTERRRMEEKALLYRKAQEEVRVRDEFISVASHELRTPVAALQLQLQLLRRVAELSKEDVPVAVSDRLGNLERQTRRVALLVSELLDLSRLRLGRLELKREPVDAAELAREVAAPFQDDRGAAGGSAVEVLAPEPAVGSFDRVRLEQVMTNLLANAVKFGEGKPITIRVEAAGGLVRIAVVDRGIGIAPGDRERIFDRFERAVTTQHFGGLGLGLYIARRIVEAHGGAIHLESAPGAGATFTVELPRDAEAAPAP
ncbi:MAG TPA: PAS domain-containing sensor histidine kinase [Anaeromyxobacteraceae bacterium]|nr:PAS domain-containing sensor histidine kinase [Anaeromyxobacteraceae bacterium]